ncbi:hypothetical protein K1T71_002302 [Dendrolimus kikuchii]|uniref:Uncharacterized protein n=1 Tax=Dendrolimus kikuchii TaxID=765133 RepID=A0ACC1DCM0_9NEOP|nr:hypothetical protein K1T71_002302 [Dendrolimus kikuchii]
MGCFFSRELIAEDMIYDMTPIRHLPVIFVNGVPGAGNQTVAQTISNITGYTMIRPGELVRAEALKDTARGRLVTEKLQALEDIPEQMTVDLIKEAMLMQKDAKGFILVGFPKNPRMSHMFNRQVKWPEKVVALEVDNEFSTPPSRPQRIDRIFGAANNVLPSFFYQVESICLLYCSHMKISLDSSGNPKALVSTLREILSDTIEKSQRSASPDPQPPTAMSAPAVGPITSAPQTQNTPPPGEGPVEVVDGDK